MEFSVLQAYIKKKYWALSERIEMNCVPYGLWFYKDVLAEFFWVRLY